MFFDQTPEQKAPIVTSPEGECGKGLGNLVSRFLQRDSGQRSAAGYNCLCLVLFFLYFVLNTNDLIDPKIQSPCQMLL